MKIIRFILPIVALTTVAINLTALADANTDLARAIRAGDLAAVKAAVAAGADLNAMDNQKMPPIGIAALLGKADIVGFLADKGADVNRNDGYGFTPLMCAAIRGKTDAAKALLDHGADPSLKGENHQDALTCAIPKGPADPAYEGKRAVSALLKEAMAHPKAAAPATPVAAANPPAAAGADEDEGLGALVKKANPKLLPPPPAPPVAQKGDVQLDGLYLQLQTFFFNGRSSLNYVHYYFFPDGHVFEGVPPGGTVKPNPGKEEWAALEKANPKGCGAYLIKGSSMTMQFAGQKPQTYKFAFEKPGNKDTVLLDGLGAVKMGRFKDKQTLDAMYEAGASMRYSSTGGSRTDSYIGTSTTINFHPDGTWTRSSASSFDTRGTSGGGTSADPGGKYTLSGNTLILTHKDGAVDSFTAYPFGDKDEFPPKHMSINGSMYQLEKR